jgi:iron(III) transport system substrate-binding protein
MGFLAEEGHLSRLSTETLELADEKARSGRGLWVGVTGRIRVLVYNTRLVRPQELPRSVFDLTGPAYRDRVAMAPANASFQDFVTGMRLKTSDAQALDWLRGLKANGARTYANNLAIVEAVGRGEVPMGLVNHYYNHQAKAQDPGLPTENYVFPDGDLGAMNLISGASVLSSSRRPELAERLIRFLLDDESQRYFAQETYEYPLAAGVPPVAGLPPLDQLNTPVFDADALGGGLTRTKELLDASGIEHA